MSESWANSLDLHLDVGRSRVRSGLEAALREALRSGRLRPGTRLPPSRALAADLGVARNTVADAYGQLTAEGWLTARTGSGTWVSAHQPPAWQPPGTPPPEAAAPRYDLRPGVPDLAGFPARAWLAARKAASAAPARVLGYPDPRGLAQLRQALAGYLARTRGVVASPDRILICAGFTHGLALLSQVLRARGGHTIAVEEYSHGQHRALAAGHGLRPVPLPVDAGGALPAGLAGAAACLLTPAHQFPLGVTLRPQRRRTVIGWAVQSGGLVIEDDYDGEFRYDRQPVGAMQALAPEHVAYAGTASKSLVPGLRLGWLVLPASLMDDIVSAKQAGGAAVSTLEELTLAEFLTSGAYDRQVRQARLTYRRRRDQLAAALHQHAPQVRVTGIAAGLHALLELPPDLAEEEVTRRAEARGLALHGLAGYRAGATPARPAGQPGAAAQQTPGTRHPPAAQQPPRAPGPPAAPERGPALVVGYARPPAHAFTTALARLCAVLADPAG